MNIYWQYYCPYEMLFQRSLKSWQFSLIYRTEPTTKKWETEQSKKRICSEVSVNSPGNPWSPAEEGKEGYACGGKDLQKMNVLSLEWKSEGVMDVGWWEWWVDGTDGRSATRRTGWVRIWEISVWLTERNRKLSKHECKQVSAVASALRNRAVDRALRSLW